MFFKDALYPLHDIKRVCPAPHYSSGGQQVRKGVTLAEPLNKTYRNFLINWETSYKQEETKEALETRVIAIERRFGMTSLLVKDPADKKKVMKILLNPIWPA